MCLGRLVLLWFSFLSPAFLFIIPCCVYFSFVLIFIHFIKPEKLIQLVSPGVDLLPLVFGNDGFVLPAALLSGADSFFYNSKKAERFQHKTQTALTTTELVAAAEIAQKHVWLPTTPSSFLFL